MTLGSWTKVPPVSKAEEEEERRGEEGRGDEGMRGRGEEEGVPTLLFVGFDFGVERFPAEDFLHRDVLWGRAIVSVVLIIVITVSRPVSLLSGKMRSCGRSAFFLPGVSFPVSMCFSYLHQEQTRKTLKKQNPQKGETVWFIWPVRVYKGYRTKDILYNFYSCVHHL